MHNSLTINELYESRQKKSPKDLLSKKTPTVKKNCYSPNLL